MKRFAIHIALTLLSAAFFCVDASAQFRKEAFSQQYNDDDSSIKDSVDVLFSLKDYFAGLSHKQEIKAGVSFAGSVVFIGGQQIYNKDYWKLPICYGTMAAGLGSGLYFNNVYKQSLAGEPNTKAKKISTACLVGAGVAYWATLMDGIASYKPSDYPHAGKATIYSILFPGLGQIYNGEMWKLPVYWGGIIGGTYFYFNNKKNYDRFRMIYNRASDPEYQGEVPIAASTALYYRNTYRRYRDYSLLTILGVYLLQVIDANVFSYMHNFDATDDFAVSLSPTVITPDNGYALSGSNTAVGMRLGFTF